LSSKDLKVFLLHIAYDALVLVTHRRKTGSQVYVDFKDGPCDGSCGIAGKARSGCDPLLTPAAFSKLFREGMYIFLNGS